jgi:hypothetical protein
VTPSRLSMDSPATKSRIAGMQNTTSATTPEDQFQRASSTFFRFLSGSFHVATRSECSIKNGLEVAPSIRRSKAPDPRAMKLT